MAEERCLQTLARKPTEHFQDREKMALRERGFEEPRSKKLSQDRVQWLGLVLAVLHIQVMLNGIYLVIKCR